MTVRHATFSPFGSRINSILANAREINDCELVSSREPPKDQSERFILQFISSSPDGVHKDTLEAVSGIELPRLSQILDRLFRAGQIMVDCGGVYRPIAVPK